MSKTCKRDVRGVRQEKAAGTQPAQSWQGAAWKEVITQTWMRPCRVVELRSNSLTILSEMETLESFYKGVGDLLLSKSLSLDATQKADWEDKYSGLIYVSA